MASAVARLKYLQMAPRKVRLVADLIRGKTVAEARDILRFVPRAASGALGKLLDSAVANAEQAAAERHGAVDPEEMTIQALQVNPGPVRKKFRAAPRGRGVVVRGRTSHVDIEISDQ